MMVDDLEHVYPATEFADDLNVCVPCARQAFLKTMLADLSADAWLDLLLLVHEEEGLRNEDGDRLDG